GDPARAALAERSGARDPARESPAYVARGERSAALGEQQSLRGACGRRRYGRARGVRAGAARGGAEARGQRRAGALEVEAHGGHGGLADGEEAGLAALALDAQLLAVVVDVEQPQRDELLRAQPAAVGEL